MSEPEKRNPEPGEPIDRKGFPYLIRRLTPAERIKAYSGLVWLPGPFKRTPTQPPKCHCHE